MDKRLEQTLKTLAGWTAWIENRRKEPPIRQALSGLRKVVAPLLGLVVGIAYIPWGIMISSIYITVMGGLLFLANLFTLGVAISADRLAADQIQRLLGAIDDLWGCIGAEEIRHLQPETVNTCQSLHNAIYHPGEEVNEWEA